MSENSTDTVIIGAGPYGLSLSAHFKHAGIEHTIFGKVMDAWHRMPKGMCLRSPARASSISDPDRLLTLERFHDETGETLGPPVPLESFIRYGHWFAESSEIDVDPRFVTRLERQGGTFVASLEDGETLRAKRVVLAAGAHSFRWTPPEFRALPSDLVSHTGDHDDFSHLAGKEVAVVGIGQMGVEAAALAAENGASVRMIARASHVRWLSRSARLHDSVLSSLLYARSDVGPAGLSRIVSAPALFRQFPSPARRRMVRRCARPAAAAWLIERTRHIPIDKSCKVRALVPFGDRLRVAYEDGLEFEVDHLLLATGYDVDLAAYRFIAPELLKSIRSVRGFPMLRRGMASSVSGLHIVGWPSTWTYGPLMRHVVGTEFTARAVTDRLVAAHAGGRQRVHTEVEPAATG